MMRKGQTGFTLIELVVVIAILAILAATALPRYIAAQQQARIAKAQGIYGGIRAAAALAHAQALTTGTTTSGTATVTMEGQLVDLINGYPVATTGDNNPIPAAGSRGVLVAAQLDDVADQLTYNGGGTAAGSTLNIRINGAATAATCQVSYTSPAAANGSPTITVVTTGC
jgi:MSHA pilin protein MshA